MAVTKYNPKDCTVIVNSVYITGLAEDMIGWEKQEPYFETSVGAQGDVVVNEINNDLHDLTVTVQATSPQLKHLLSLKSEKAEFPVWVENKSLKVKFGGTKARIAEMPSISLGTNAEDVEIKLTVFDGTTTIS